MNAFAAALPLINFAGRDFREVDRELERFERRRVFVAGDRPLDALEPFALRRLRPPLAEPPERRHMAQGSTGLYIRIPHFGFTGSVLCNANIAVKLSSFAGSMSRTSSSASSTGGGRRERPRRFQMDPNSRRFVA